MSDSTDSKAYELRSVDRFIAVLNNGDDCADATTDYRALVKTLAEHVERFGGTAKGKLILTLDIAADSKGVNVTMSSQVKVPDRPKFVDRYFISPDGDTLTAMDPGKETLFEGVNMGRRRPMSA